LVQGGLPYRSLGFGRNSHSRNSVSVNLWADVALLSEVVDKVVYAVVLVGELILLVKLPEPLYGLVEVARHVHYELLEDSKELVKGRDALCLKLLKEESSVAGGSNHLV